MLKLETVVVNDDVKKYLNNHNHNFNSRVGWFGNKKRQAVEKNKHQFSAYGLGRKKRTGKNNKVNISNEEIVYKHIYGKGVPVRNFFKLAGSKKYWEKNNFNFIKDYFSKTPDVSQTLRSWNNLSKAIVRRSILDIKYPPNSKKTIKRKGFNKPLIDSQQMLKGLDVKGFEDSNGKG